MAHSNAPGAQLGETAASGSDADDKSAASKFGGNTERCQVSCCRRTFLFNRCSPHKNAKVCSKRVYATERLPLDGATGQEVLHKSCLKCADCQSTLKMDTYVRVEGAFYCKR
jgi:hypothetical protein